MVSKVSLNAKCSVKMSSMNDWKWLVLITVGLSQL